jgi:heme exporter protein A
MRAPLRECPDARTGNARDAASGVYRTILKRRVEGTSVAGAHIPLNPDLRIAVSGLACSRGGRLLFEGLSFTLGAGEALAVTGPNGVGKTTLIRAIAGFVRPDSGTIRLDGMGPETSLPQSAHFLGHRDGLRAALTVRENLALAPSLLGGSGASTPDAAERLALGRLLDLPVGVLSAGQRRRVALARLLVAPRPLWLLDEPTASLDAGSQQTTAAIMAEHVAAGGIVVAATHLRLGLTVRELTFAPDGSHRLMEAAA